MMSKATAMTGTWLSQCSPALRLLIVTSWLAPETWRPRQDEAIQEACAAGVDWDEYARLVERHRTPAVSWTALKRVTGLTIPEETAKDLKRRSDACRIKAAIHLLLLTKVLKGLSAAGISAMPLKGPLLSLELYGDAGLRDSKDLDVLVELKDLPGAQQCLSELGWEAKSDNSRLSPRQAEFWARHEWHVSFLHKVQHCELELHWRTTWDDKDNPSRRMATSVRRELQGSHYQAMDAVELTINLCEHGSSHAWFRAKWLGDVARILADQRAAAETVLMRARWFGQDRPLLQGMRLVQDAFGLPIPETIEREIRALNPCVIERAVRKLIDPEEPRPGLSISSIREYLLNAIYVRRVWPRRSMWDILEETAFRLSDFEVIRLSDRLFWLYVPLRPFLWAWRRRKMAYERSSNDADAHTMYRAEEMNMRSNRAARN
jgi:hypothetical protein